MDQDNSSHPNPFHPNGPLAIEAEEIVNLIKQGKPITPAASPNLKNHHSTKTNDQTDSPESKKKDKKKLNKKDLKEFEVNKMIISNNEASYAEMIHIAPEDDKKKKDSMCCVIQ